MKKLLILAMSAMTLFSVNLSTAYAEPYQVSITNLTRGQIFSPVFAMTHNRQQSLFTSGEAASPELAALAQDANTDALTDLLSNSAHVHQISQGTGVIQPGQTASLIINSHHRARFISLASMLVSTNDAFIALNKFKLPRRSVSIMIPAYDAGAEANDESCAYIPGPPCGNANSASAEEGEGFVHIHSGIHGGGDLNVAQHDWRNPVAKISIRRIKKHN